MANRPDISDTRHYTYTSWLFSSVQFDAPSRQKSLYISFRIHATGSQFIHVHRSKDLQAIRHGEGISFNPSSDGGRCLSSILVQQTNWHTLRRISRFWRARTYSHATTMGKESYRLQWKISGSGHRKYICGGQSCSYPTICLPLVSNDGTPKILPMPKSNADECWTILPCKRSCWSRHPPDGLHKEYWHHSCKN